jgi:hypothetical protein
MNRIRLSRCGIISLAFGLVLLGGCDQHAQKVPRVEGVTAIRVYGPSADPARMIDDAEELARVVAFINERRSGWHVPEVDAPLPAVTAVLYGGGRKYTFSAAPQYFSSGPIYLLSRRASPEEFQQFLRLVGIEDTADR